MAGFGGFDLQQLALQQLQVQAQAAQQGQLFNMYRQQQQQQGGIPPGMQGGLNLPQAGHHHHHHHQHQHQHQQHQHQLPRPMIPNSMSPQQAGYNQYARQPMPPAVNPEQQKKLQDLQYSLQQEEEHERSNIAYSQTAQQQQQSQENFKKALEQKESALETQVKTIEKREEDIAKYEAGLDAEKAKVTIARDMVEIVREGNEWLHMKNQKVMRRQQYYNPFTQVTCRFVPVLSASAFHQEYRTEKVFRRLPEATALRQYNRLWLNGDKNFTIKPSVRETAYIRIVDEFVGTLTEDPKVATIVKVVLIENEIGDPHKHPSNAMSVWGRQYGSVFDLYTGYHEESDGPADQLSTHARIARRALLKEANLTLPEKTAFAHLCSTVDDAGVTTYYVIPSIEGEPLALQQMKLEITETKTIKVPKPQEEEAAEDAKMETDETEKPAEGKTEEAETKDEDKTDEEKKEAEEKKETDEAKKDADAPEDGAAATEEKPAGEEKAKVEKPKLKKKPIEYIDQTVTETRQVEGYKPYRMMLPRIAYFQQGASWSAGVAGASLEDTLRYKHGLLLVETLKGMPVAPPKVVKKEAKETEDTTGKRKRDEDEEETAELQVEEQAKKQRREVERFERVVKTQVSEEVIKCRGVKPFLYIDRPTKPHPDAHWARSGIVGVDDM
eukprot:gene17805-27424_t